MSWNGLKRSGGLSVGYTKAVSCDKRLLRVSRLALSPVFIVFDTAISKIYLCCVEAERVRAHRSCTVKFKLNFQVP